MVTRVPSGKFWQWLSGGGIVNLNDKPELEGPPVSFRSLVWEHYGFQLLQRHRFAIVTVSAEGIHIEMKGLLLFTSV